MDIGRWLNGIGLGQYVALFREHEIDAEVLPDLTDADLEKIGVPLGHRKKLIKALAALGVNPLPPAAKPAPAAASPPPPAARADAERRPITVMFCDLVGSTNLAARLDAEDWRNLVGAYLDEASAAVTALGGHVLKKLGDGLMALFGYPQAQENDAERAVRAALAIQRALAELNSRNAGRNLPQLAARIGIESGQVVVDAAGEVFGEAPNVAARVQAAAEPGTVLVTASVQRQTAGLFVAEDKGAHDFKGVPAPVALYRIVRASGAGRRGGARALTPLVGREDELALLTRRWSRALAGEGQFVQIVGEPGIGKSRLIEEFRAKLAETPHTWVEWAASQLLQNTPLHPLAEWGRLRYGGADASDEQKLADLENTLRLIGLDAAEYAPLLAPLFDVALPEDRAAKFAPEELRRRQLAAMTALFLAGARSQPVVLAFEDLHWADPTSLDLLRALVERGAQAPLLIVATTRPEFRPDWSLRSHHSVISLAPLDRAQVRKMVGEIANRHALSDETIDGVGERTGGVPLFVEEVTRLLLERDAQGGAQAIPPTLQQSLAARLDRLGEAREVAQIGAVLGRDFSFRLLSDVSSSAAGFDELRLRAALDRLTEADLLFVDGAPPTAAYRFKHALIRDAAYESLLKSRRQALHRRAAEALRDANAEPEVIAHHFTEAGLDDLAIEWWGKAGDQALRRSAFQEAIAHLGKAITMADKAAGATARRATGGSVAQDQRLTHLHIAYGNAAIAARGPGAPETTEAFTRARESAYGDKDASERLAAEWGLWASSYTRGELPSMRAHAVAFLSDVETRPESPEAGVAHRAAGTTCWFAGEYREARDHLERALALFQPGRDDELAFRFGHDPGVVAIGFLAITLWPLGEVDRAISLIEHMQTRMADLSHVGTLAFGRMHTALFELMRGDTARAAPNAFELARLAREHDLVMWRALGVFLQGCATAASGSIGGGLEDMRRGAELLSEQKVLVFDGLLKIALAEAEARAGDSDRAIAILDEALVTADRLGNRAFEAELHRVRGEILLKRDPADPPRVEEDYLAAIAIAKQQTARSFELRASLSLAKLYQSTGRPGDAHAILAPALEGFAPTPEMPEIAEAQALVAALAESEEVRAEVTKRRRLTQLNAAYGNALIAARGHGAPETIEAFARALKSASGDEDAPGRFAADYGLWVGSFVRGDLPSMRTHAAAFLAGVAATPDSPEAGVAHRVLGTTHWFAGEYAEAREHLERALTLFQPGRDDDLAFRFGQDAGVAAMCYLAIASWPLGNVRRAVSLVDGAHERLASVAHIGTHPYAKLHGAMFELMRGDRARAAENGSEAARLAREHDLPLWRAYGAFFEGLATAERGALGEGLSDMRRCVESLRQQDLLNFDGLFKIALAEAEARAGDRDRAVVIIDEALATADRLGYRAFEAELNRTRGQILLECDPANPAPAEEAFLTAIAVAKRQATRSFELRAALSLGRLYQSTGQSVEAHAVLAPALEDWPRSSLLPSGRRAGDEGYRPDDEGPQALTPDPSPDRERGTAAAEMPELAEARALLAALAQTDEVEAQAAQRQRLTQLRVAYGNALFPVRGFGAPETTEAFARARESSSGDGNAPGRLAVDYGLWVGCFTRGDLPSMRAHAAAFLSDIETRPDSPEAGVAHRAAGVTCWFAGEYREAQDHLEWALAQFQPGRDDDLAFRFGVDPGAAAMVYLAFASWPLGEVDRAISLIDRMHRRIANFTHVSTLGFAVGYAAFFALMRDDRARAEPDVFEYARLARAQELTMFRAFAMFLEGWATAADGAAGGGLEDMRRGAELLREQNVLLFDGLLKIALAEAEAQVGDSNRAVAILDEALATADRLGYRAFEAELHRARGEILLECDPANPAPAEDALLTAIAVANQQGTRSFGLRAALALAKLCQSTNRPADAHAVLAPALDGFAPTSQMPELQEAQTLLAALAETDEVKAEATRRQRLTQLHATRGVALFAARGGGAPETMAAFARARERTLGDEAAPERFVADFGLWVGSYVRGELPSMRAHAAAFLSDVAAKPDSPEAGVAHRTAGITCWFAGEYREARDHLERALVLFQPGRDDDLAFRFGSDPGTATMVNLANASWPLGEVDRAISLIDRAQLRSADITHAGALAFARMHSALFDLMRRDHASAAPKAFELAQLAREHGLTMHGAFGAFLEGWASAAGGAPGGGLADMRRAVDELREQNVLLFDGLLKIALAEAEARAGDSTRAIAILDEALATSDRTGYRAFEAELHRARGEMLLQRDPFNPAPAEDAFLTAIAVAKQQGTRCFELRAALALAKLYQSAGRPAQAHDALAPALEGFSRTPQMPEIAEAQALLAALAETDDVKAATKTRHKRVDLQIALGNALIAARGYGAAETQASFERARALTFGIGQEPERFSIAYGLYAVSYHRGDVARMREHASAFLSGVSGRPDSPEAGVAHRISGIYSWYVGDLVDARAHLEKALAISDPERDRDLAFRFGHDPRISASVQLGVVLWLLGEVVRAAQLFQDVGASIPDVSHLGTTAQGNLHAAVFEVMRRNHVRAAEFIRALGSVAYEHDLALWKTLAFFLEGWSAWRSGDRNAGLVQMRAGVAQLAEREISLFSGLIRTELAQAEAESGEVETSLVTLENALAYCERIGQRWFDAEIHRVRGEILLKKHLDSPAPAEDAYLAAIAIAQRQKARSFELRAALSLAKLYQSTGRGADAHAVLGRALEGFSPTPEMPEIAEAQALLGALA